MARSPGSGTNTKRASAESIWPRALMHFGMLAALGFSIVFFVSPLIYVIVESFLPPLLSDRPASLPTLDNYWTIVSDSFYLETLWRTIRISAIASAIMLVVGYPVAYYLRIVSPKVRGRLLFFVISPLLVSVVVRTYGWVILLSKEGLLNTVLLVVGIDTGFTRSTHLFNETAVIVGLAHVFCPFMVLALYNSLQKLNLSLLRAAANLGASPMRAFLEVTLPLTLPGVLAGITTVFPLVMGSFITVSVLGGPSVWVLSMSAYQEATGLMNWQLAGAIGVSLLLAVTMCVGIFSWSIGRLTFEGARAG